MKLSPAEREVVQIAGRTATGSSQTAAYGQRAGDSAVHTQASSKVQDEILIRVIRDLGGVIDQDGCIPQSEGAQPFPYHYTS